MRRSILLLALFAGSLGAPTAQAEPTERAPQSITPRSSGSPSRPVGGPGTASRSRSQGSGWWTTGGALAVVVVLILATAKVLRKGVPQAGAVLPREAVHVLGRRMLDYRNTICLVRCGSRLLVLGSSQNGLTTLAEIADRAEVDYLSGLCQPAERGAKAASFSRLFSRFQREDDEQGDDDRVATDQAAAEGGDEDPTVLRLQGRLAALQSEAPAWPESTAAREHSG